MKEDLASNAKKIVISVMVLIVFVVPSISFAKNKNDLVSSYIKAVYNRYSKHFDKNGWVYSQPAYGILKKKPTSAREWLMFASYYKYRAANNAISAKKIIDAINKGYSYLNKYSKSPQSFEESIAYFLSWRVTKESVANRIDKEKIFRKMRNSLFKKVKVKDTENRALIAAVIDSYLADQLFKTKQITKKERAYLLDKNRKKLNRGIKECVGDDYWYLEGDQKTFSAHYHTLSAYMLMFYGDYFNEKKYLKISKKMTENMRKISFSNGFVEARMGMRPIGSGAQTYLMLGLLNKGFDYSDYSVYLNFARKGFFTDKNHRDRLEFHSTIKNTKPNFHDDIGFSLVAEMSLINKEIRNTKINARVKKLKNTLGNYRDNRFNIKNKGSLVIINNKEYKLLPNGFSSEVRFLGRGTNTYFEPKD